MSSLLVHATCISIDGKGVLLLGDSGVGKSDLALRLIDRGAQLVSDDQVQLTCQAGGLYASAPKAIEGLLEMRGIGIEKLSFASNISVLLVIQLVARTEVERMPEPTFFDCMGVAVPLLLLHAFDSSTEAKIRRYVDPLTSPYRFCMKLVLVTGMSGAGKSVALKSLEDNGFEAIDNLPLSFLPTVAASVARTENLAIGTDIRSRDFSVEHFIETIQPLRDNPDIDFKVLFLDCHDELLRRRFTETRRRHPLALDRTVMDGIRHERRLLEGLREASDVVIDTSQTEAAALRAVITAHFAASARHLSVVLTSFSFKRGVPSEADIVFDVRFLKNPYYDESLRHLTGQDALVGAYIESDPDFVDFFKRLTDLIVPLLPRYLEEGKHYLTIAIGCTGGRHRSVYTVKKLGAFLDGSDYKVTLRHRDLEHN